MKPHPFDSDHDDETDTEPSAVRVRAETTGSAAALAFHAFLEAIPLPSWIHDLHTRELLAVNDALVALIGRSREALIGSSTLDLYEPGDRPAVARLLDQLVENPPSGTVEYPAPLHLRTPGGLAVQARMSSNAVPAIRPHARLVVVRDVGSPAPASASVPAPASEDRVKADERHPTEAAIAQSEERYRTLFEACPIAACVFDLATLQLLAVNEAMVHQYGYDRDELLTMNVFDLVAPEDTVTVEAILHDVRSGEQSGVLRYPHTIRHRVCNGAELDVELIAAPLTYGGTNARLVLHNDVTERKRGETDLVRRARIDAFRADLGAAMVSDEPLAAHFEHVVEAMVHHLDLASVGIWTLDEATGQLLLHAHAGDLDASTACGLSISFGETWIGRAAARGGPLLLDTWDPQMRPLEVACAQELGVTHVGAFPIIVRRRVLGVVRRRVVGVISAGRTSSFPDDLIDILRATAGQISQTLGTAFAYEALRTSESLSRSILDNMLSALFTLDEDGMIESVNPAAQRTFGLTPEELIGEPFTTLFHDPTLDHKSLVSNAIGRVTEWRGRKKTGELFPCEMRLFPLDSPRGSGYAAILHDVSERYEVERLKSEFVSVVSHELRTPLTALRGSIGLLTGGVLGGLPPDVMELLTIAERNTLRLISLVNDILDLERLQKGRMELFVEPVNAREIVRRSMESVKPFADQERIAIDVRCVDDMVTGDGDRLVQVLVNLLSNAVKFSPAGSLIEVSNTVEAEDAVFRITDHGRGIPPSHRRTIFERFEQVRATDAREKGGTGLGLAISKAIVEQHGGTIGVESEEGTGSTFWFRVPRAVAT